MTPQPFQKDSYRNPKGVRQDTGYGYGKGSKENAPSRARELAETESRDRYHDALAWAKRNLPDEYAPFAASAYLTLNLNPGTPTAEQVRARLRDQGRTMAQLD